MTEPLEAELVETGESTTTATLVPVTATSTLVRPAAELGQIEAAFAEYGRVCDALLDPSDYQQIADKAFRKKSAWRKLAVAFGVSCEILNREYDRDDKNRIIRAEVVVRATAPNGRTMDGLGACDVFERCCSKPCSKSRWSNHTCCPTDCDGANHFSHAQHDIPATAATRATNRACADLFGFGEVSAEEVVGEGEPAPRRQHAQTPVERAGQTAEASEPQRKKIYVLLKELGIEEKEAQKAKVASVLGRTPAAGSPLTKSEASKVIDALNAEKEDG